MGTQIVSGQNHAPSAQKRRCIAAHCVAARCVAAHCVVRALLTPRGTVIDGARIEGISVVPSRR